MTGHTYLVKHDLSHEELGIALSDLARAEGVHVAVQERLAKSEAASPEPEQFLNTIIADLDHVYFKTVQVLVTNLDKWFLDRLGVRLTKAMNPPAGRYLTQAQLDELLALIQAHFRSAISLGVAAHFGRDTSAAIEAEWKRIGIVPPNVSITHALRDAFTAGRLYEVLRDNSTFEQMRAAARSLPVGRATELALAATQREAALWFLEPTQNLERDVSVAVTRQNAEVVREVISRYVDGSLRPSARNADGELTPEEVAATETDGAVHGWQRLARELRNRLLSTDGERDWHRVAATETRFSYNMGRIAEFGEKGVRGIEWSVQPDACRYCKTLLLHPDGTPITFPMQTFEDLLRETGGTNFGRKASLIGRPGGWLPTAIIHPWCRCLPYPAGVLARIRRVSV